MRTFIVSLAVGFAAMTAASAAIAADAVSADTIATAIVSHSFNASQGSAGALPVEGGVVIFYGMRHEIGRGMMRDSLVEAMEEIRAAWQS